MLDQSEIDTLLASATNLAAETSHQVGIGTATAAPPATPRAPVQVDPRELRRILHMRFPLIVVLAERKLPFQEILRWTAGSIVEFDRSSEGELDLVVGNRRIGSGQAVKVGEYFGLRVSRTESVEDRIRAMSR